MALMNKKGVFFTLMAIIILSLFILSIAFFTHDDERGSVQRRVETLNNFVLSVEEDIPRQLFIVAFRTLFLFEKHIIETGTYISDVNASFQEAFYNGTFLGVSQDLLIGTTFRDIESGLTAKSQKMNANVTLNNSVFVVDHEDPWNVRVTLFTDLKIEDNSGLVAWNKRAQFVRYIPVENFDDPLYIFSTNGLVSNKIVQTPYENFVTGLDISNLSSHATNSYYIASSTGPSFLDRLEGKNGANLQGIESLVNLDTLSQQGITVEEKSSVDYIYFTATNDSNCPVQPSGMPSWFRLDNAHLATYQVACA